MIYKQVWILHNQTSARNFVNKEHVQVVDSSEAGSLYLFLTLKQHHGDVRWKQLNKMADSA